MASRDKSSTAPEALAAPTGRDPAILRPLPGQVEIRAPKGTLPASRAGTKHGWHSAAAVQIPTSLTCALCPLYHVKRKDRRHPLACPEGRKHRICPILTRLQQQWAEGLICEIQEATGSNPTPSDNARIEQIIRHRSRIFQMENYLKVAGLIDLAKGEIRNVADRLTTTENALSRSLTEFRQAMGDRRDSERPAGPRLDEYLTKLAQTQSRIQQAAPEDSADEEAEA
jgi:hypothetical protein